MLVALSVRTASDGQVGECPCFMNQPRQPVVYVLETRWAGLVVPPKLPGTRKDDGPLIPHAH